MPSKVPEGLGKIDARDDLGLKPNGKRWSPLTTYKPEYCDLVVDLMKNGLTYIEVAANIVTSIKTFEGWRLQFPEFNQACEIGATLAEAWYEKIGRGFLVTDPHKSSAILNDKIWIYKMKSRFKHYDKERDIRVETTDLNALSDLMSKLTKDMHKETI